MPFASLLPIVPFTIERRPKPATPQEALLVSAHIAIVTPGLFGTLAIPLIHGRDFSAGDSLAGPWSVVINEAMAQKFWPSGDALGRRLTISLTPDERPREIIGIVRNTRLTPYQRDPEPIMYVLHNQQPLHGGRYSWARLQMTFLLRTKLASSFVVPMLRQAIAELDPDRPLTAVRPLEARVGRQLQETRYVVDILGVFAGAALLLATVGLYGVVAYGVSQRTREIGVRVALGAGRASGLSLVVRHTVVLVAISVLLGIGGSLAASRLLTASLWGMTPTDPPTYVVVCVAIAVVGLLAAVLPARRALGVQPTVALRPE